MNTVAHLDQLDRRPRMSTRASLASIGCLVVAVCGCAAIAPPPDAEMTVDVPPTWSVTVPASPPTASSLIQWWSRFDDPLLARLVTQALQSNTSVTGAQAALRQARAARDVAAAGLVPTLDGSASAQRSSAASGATRTTDTFQAGLDADWELDIFGARRSALNAAEAVARASAASLGEVHVSVAAEVALAYIALRGAQLRLAIARDNLANQRETLQITLWRQQAGLVTAVEAEQARTAMEQTSALVPALQTTIDQSRHALSVLTGRPPAALSDVLAADGPVPQAADALALTIPAETLRQRPDVRAAEHQVTAAVARVAQADAVRWPSFNIGGSLGLKSATLGSLAERASLVGSLLAGLSMPLFDGGAARAQVRAQQATLDQARSTYRAAVFTALTDVEDALVALRGDRERLTHLRRAAESAGSAALLARQRYASGLIDFQTVLETQRTQLSTQDGVASARADLGADHVRLYKALGGGWDPGTGTAASALREGTPWTDPS